MPRNPLVPLAPPPPIPMGEGDHRYQRRCPACAYQSPEDFFDEGLASLTTPHGIGMHGCILCRACGRTVDRFLLVDTHLGTTGEVIAECLARPECSQPDHPDKHPCVKWRDRFVAYLQGCNLSGHLNDGATWAGRGVLAPLMWSPST